MSVPTKAAGIRPSHPAATYSVASAAAHPQEMQASLGENRRSAALATLCLVLFLTFLDIYDRQCRLAGIQTQLRAGVSSLQWVVGAYALTFAASMLTFGTLGDQFGRKKISWPASAFLIAGR